MFNSLSFHTIIPHLNKREKIMNLYCNVNKKKMNNELTCSQPVTMNIFKYSQFCNKIINQTETQSFSFITVAFCCLFMSLDLSKIILEFASNFGCLMSFLISSIPT